ncbi:MAG: porin family protein [Saprospiraceae bacterium]|nr:PorT family protein [Saprospiraceae bacterium]MCB9344337.1 PorT family protein [Lewinellaceae bacterium]
MKKIVLLSCLLVFIGSNLYSQDFRSVRFGLQASPTWSWLRTDDKKIEGLSSNWGLKLGAMGEFYFARNYAITTGLGFGFNQGGFLQNGYDRGVFWPKSDLSSPGLDTLPQNAKLHYRVNYVEIPIGLKMRGGSGEDSRMKFYAEIPVFTLGFVTKGTGDIRGTNTQNSDDENIRPDVNGLSLAWGLGAGVEYEFATNATLVAGLAYQRQFTDMTKNKGAVEFQGDWEKENSKATANILALKLGILF